MQMKRQYFFASDKYPVVPTKAVNRAFVTAQLFVRNDFSRYPCNGVLPSSGSSG